MYNIHVHVYLMTKSLFIKQYNILHSIWNFCQNNSRKYMYFILSRILIIITCCDVWHHNSYEYNFFLFWANWYTKCTCMYDIYIPLSYYVLNTKNSMYTLELVGLPWTWSYDSWNTYNQCLSQQSLFNKIWVNE